jgi:outer membrane protein W
MRKQILVCLSFVVFAQIAYADDDYVEHREWEVTGFWGNSFAKTFEFSTPVHGADTESLRNVGMHFGSGYQIGVRLENNVKEHVGVDLEYSFAHQNLSFTNLAPSQSVSVTQYVHYLSYNIAYLPMPAFRRFRPYGVVGVGTALYFLPEASKEAALEQELKIRDSWAFLVNCGGGFKYLLKDQFAITFDAKDRLFTIPSYGLPSSARMIGGRFEPGMFTHGIGQTWQVNVGLTFQWDQD